MSYDPYRRDHYDYWYGRRHWRRRRPVSDTAGKIIVGALVLMALHQAGRSTDEPARPVEQPPVSELNEAPRAPAGADSKPPGRDPPQQEASRPKSNEDVHQPTAPQKVGDECDEQTNDGAEKVRANAPAGCTSSVCRQAYVRYATAQPGKAFVTSRDGQGFWKAGEDSVSEAIRQAIQSCQEFSGAPCELSVVEGASP